MSESALVKGIQSRLRTIFADTDGSRIGYHPELKPPPAFGQWYIAIGQPSSSRGDTRSGDANDRVYNCKICLTWKLGYAPEDRQGLEIIHPDTVQDFAGPAPPTEQETEWMPILSITDFADQIAGYLIEDYTVINLMNTYIPGFGVTTNGFIEPFHDSTVGNVESKDGGWIGAKGGNANIKAITISLSGARRIRVRGTIY